MPKLLLLLIIALLGFRALGQLTPEQQRQVDAAMKKAQDPAIQAKMRIVQHMMDSLKKDTAIQNRMKQANAQLEQMKKSHPELAGYSMPDMNKNPTMPNFDSINQQIKKSTQTMKSYNAMMAQGLPKADPLHSAGKLQKLTAAATRALVQNLLKQVTPQISVTKLPALKAILDSCHNLAGLGAFLLANNASINETMYLVCHALVRNPTDLWSVNNLGVYYRGQTQYETALQCFFYAQALDSGKSAVLATNIGWASLYYGDFDGAAKYFNAASSIDPDFLSPLEGQALLAYQRGDIQALFKCLAKELQATMRSGGGGSGGGSGGGGAASQQGSGEEASDAFVDQAATAYVQSVKTLDDQPDPTQDHSLDGLADDGPDQDPPPGADVVDVTYPEYRPIFVGRAEDLQRAKADAVKFMLKSSDKLITLQKNVQQELSSLRPLVTSTSADGTGKLTVSKSFRKFVDLMAEANRLFERRVYWWVKKFDDDYKPWPNRMFTHNQDNLNGFLNDGKACPNPDPDNKCSNRVLCKWIPLMTTSCNSDIESMTRLWNPYWDHISETIQWYLNVTGPLISRVHDVGWNQYLNDVRIFYISQAVLQAYNRWATAVVAIPVPSLVGATMPTCTIDINGMDPPDPFSKKPKKIKQFQGPCYDHDWPIGPLSIEETCNTTKYTLGYKNIGLFWETAKDPVYAQNNFANRVGANFKVDYSLGVEDVAIGKTKLTYNAGIDVKAAASIWGDWNTQGQFAGGGSDVNAGVTATGEISAGGPLKVGGSTGVGVDASNTYVIVAGQLQTGPPTIKVTR